MNKPSCPNPTHQVNNLQPYWGPRVLRPKGFRFVDSFEAKITHVPIEG